MAKTPFKLKDSDPCITIGGTHTGKSGAVRDIRTGKSGLITIAVLQKNDERFKTPVKNAVIEKGK